VLSDLGRRTSNRPVMGELHESSTLFQRTYSLIQRFSYILNCRRRLTKARAINKV